MTLVIAVPGRADAAVTAITQAPRHSHWVAAVMEAAWCVCFLPPLPSVAISLSSVFCSSDNRMELPTTLRCGRGVDLLLLTVRDTAKDWRMAPL